METTILALDFLFTRVDDMKTVVKTLSYLCLFIILFIDINYTVLTIFIVSTLLIIFSNYFQQYKKRHFEAELEALLADL